MPTKDDDITVKMTTENADYYYFGVKNTSESLMEFWCGKEAPESIEPAHFGDVSGISTKILDADYYESLIVPSYVHATGDEERYMDPFYSLPEHLSADYGLLLFRYLRNWIAATHGHKFKDVKLKECYSGIKRKKEAISAIERKNIEFLLKQERVLSKKSKQSWEKVRSNLLPQENLPARDANTSSNQKNAPDLKTVR